MPRAPWACFTVVGALLCGVYLLLPPVWQTVLFVLLALGGAGGVLGGLRLHRPARPAPWLLIAAGVLFWALGDVLNSVYEHFVAEVPYPSFADVLYLAGYVGVAAGINVAIRRSGVRDAVAWQDAAIWALGGLILAWPWLIEPLLTAPDEPLLTRVTATTFPMLDLVLLLLMLRLVTGRSRGPSVYGALALGLLPNLVSEAAYGGMQLAGTYDGGLVDLGWIVSYTAIGAIGLHPRMVDLTAPVRRVPRTSSRFRLVALGATVLLAPGLLLLQHLRGEVVDALFIGIIAAVLFCLTTVRGAGLLREVEALAGELRGRERELHRRATTDALTGLANRAVLSERLERDVAAGVPFCVALLDLDEFKHVNDSRGHEAGDLLLLEVSRRLVASLREQDLVVRLGGDEFAVVSDVPAGELAERLLACLSGSVVLTGGDVVLRASIGVAAFAPAASTAGRASPSELLRNADLAMYAAKNAGGQQSAVYRPAMSTELLARLDVREELAAAVQAEQFAAWFQPVVDLATHRLLGFEALARWRRPGAPPVAPAEWMAAAEETGLVVQVDEQVLRAAARQLVSWSATVPGAALLDLAVNASGRSLREPDVAERVLQVLLEEGLSPRRLVLEVTEGVLIDEAVGGRLQRLREAGVRIALDDFGTGWSSLTYLRRFPVDLLKLDRSFVAGIADGGGSEAVPAAVFQLAEALGLDVVAEGIETPEQAAVLRRLGCRSAQGNLLARPAPAAELAEIVRRGRVEGRPVLAAVPDAQRG